MNSLFVDTSGWVSLIGADEAYHAQVAADYADALRGNRRLVTINYVLTEVVALLTTRTIILRQQMFAFVNALQSSPHIDIVFIERSVHSTAWALLQARADKRWSLVDASSFVVMQQLGITEALTLDSDFAQAGFSRLPRP